MSRIISIKLAEDLLAKIDLLVKRRIFRNRSQALGQIIKNGLERDYNTGLVTAPDLEKLESLIHEFQKSGGRIRLVTTKSSVDLVTEGRER